MSLGVAPGYAPSSLDKFIASCSAAGFNEELDSWIDRNAALARRFTSVAVALREQACRAALPVDLHDAVQQHQDVKTTPEGREIEQPKATLEERLQAERCQNDILKLREECQLKDEEIEELRARVRQATVLRDKTEARLAELKQERASLKEMALREGRSIAKSDQVFSHPSHNDSSEIDGETARGSLQSTPRMARAVSYPRVSSPGGMTPKTRVGGGSMLVPSRSEDAIPKSVTAVVKGGRGGSTDWTSSLRQHRPGSVERCRRVQVSKSVTTSSPRQRPLSSIGASVPAERKVRFAERLQESPRVRKETRVAPKSRSSPRTSPSPMLRSPPSQASALLPAIAALRGEVEIVSAAAGTDPNRYRAQLVGAVRQRLATVEMPLDVSSDALVGEAAKLAGYDSPLLRQAKHPFR